MFPILFFPVRNQSFSEGEVILYLLVDSIRRKGGVEDLNAAGLLLGQEEVALADFFMKGLGFFLKTGFLFWTFPSR